MQWKHPNLIYVITFIFALFTPLAFAAFPPGLGPYLGLQLGGASNHYSLGMLGLNQGQVHYEGFAERAYVGYQFNPYISLESGILHFKPALVRAINGTETQGTIKDYNIDLLVAGNFGFDNGYYAFGKFGVGYHMAFPSEEIRHASTSYYSNSFVAHYRPVGAVGVGYALTRRFGLEASYFHVLKEREMAEGKFWSLAVTYHFYDFYLCRTLF